MKHGYLIDMDGVLYRGSEIIPGAEEFIRQLRQRNIPFRFLTFLKFAFPMMLMSIIVSTIYIYLVYLI